MKMRDDTTTIITRADVYTHEIPSTTDSVITSSEDSPPTVQTPVSLVGYDVLDDTRLGKMTPETTPLPATSTAKLPENEILNADVEVIEEAMPIVRKILPMPEPTPRIERNGLDAKKPVHELEEPDACLINCIYFTQQCCSCTIV